ncbi:uncharacterized protein CIMG_10628 [Coccidioides immitis RS]|uniref:Integral membrane protein n=7 Tax=Coccidioides TaxID=5500 RepID=A0A0D8JSJ8_COCIM|nr:hypothetical protein CPC735_054570 [Coccidioides posadasii C735 delta SOWgp]XP_012214264.1 uncharacterized protein CIMG_10628 [Coccidioides immitis RS]EFW15641.1 integral membrane protein [Coccidioides posadasii str. Silveira]KMM65669.1 integral membrane protein [Coccidioides posadasii RMSCC 3488]KMP00751.1 integral membrane protein [Coccidioides immitis RMSCC 2394]KMU75585.1 integral membrane protein [Coccidioides immitis RMSCC 3703]KMU85418.1 integral membrane protein [Coccidioides immit|eukprot:XP_003066232.1 hypothetical protein CPC735_054570 [Coccidioides posadasii C735 delta SOWgp]
MFVPGDYSVPPFPSLYTPLGPSRDEAKYLVFTGDMWRFTLFWTLILYSGVHIAAAACVVITQWHSWKVIWAVPVFYILIAGLEGLLAGSVVGLLIGAVYEAGNLKMITWLPFIWGCINTLVLILSGFSIQGGL